MPSISGSITGSHPISEERPRLRLLSSIDWPLFFERVSLVERILRGDPAGAYARMDFPTRDRYRHSVEELAKGADVPEQDVATRAVDLARQAQQATPEHDRAHHVGYYLISRGRFKLEREVGYPPTYRERLARFVYGHPALGYLGTIGKQDGVDHAIRALALLRKRRQDWHAVIAGDGDALRIGISHLDHLARRRLDTFEHVAVR